MNKGAFMGKVQERVNLPSKEMAEAGAQVVLSLLSHRLTPEESRHVEAQLPKDLKSLWNSDTWITNHLEISGQFQLRYRHKEEFYSLIRNELDKLQIPVGPEQLAIAVFSVLKEYISEGEVKDITGQLPGELEEVWASA